MLNGENNWSPIDGQWIRGWTWTEVSLNLSLLSFLVILSLTLNAWQNATIKCAMVPMQTGPFVCKWCKHIRTMLFCWFCFVCFVGFVLFCFVLINHIVTLSIGWAAELWNVFPYAFWYLPERGRAPHDATELQFSVGLSAWRCWQRTSGKP